MITKQHVTAFKEACRNNAKEGIDYLFFQILPKGKEEVKIQAAHDFIIKAGPLCGGANFQGSYNSPETVINNIPNSAEKTALRETAKFFGLHP